METKSTNGVLNPRLYQVFGDSIDSKQAMEPLAIAIGPGPVSGFNAISYDADNNTVTFTSFDDPEATGLYPKETKYRGYTEGNGYKAISDPSNNIARPLNAHITRDGLLHTSTKITLPFTPNKGWPNLTYLTGPNFGISFILKAKHTYVGQVHSSLDNPVTFEIRDISNIGGNGNPWSILSNHSYTTLCESLSKDGYLDINTETLIGIYTIGWDPTWGTPEFKYTKDLSRDLGWVTSMVFYNGRMPYISQNPLVLDKCNRVVDSLEYLTSQSVGYLSIDIENKAVSVFKLKYRDRENDPTAIDVVSLDTSKIEEDGSGYFIVEYLDKSSSLTGVDFDGTLVTQATIYSGNFIGNRPRVEFVQHYTEDVPVSDITPDIYFVKHYFKFWIDPGSYIQNTIKIRGIVQVNK